MVAISTSEWDDLAFREERLREGLTLLSDAGEEVISLYGLEDETLGSQVARPATFVLDDKGTIRWRHLPTDWRRRLSPVDYLKVFDALDRGVSVPELSHGEHP